MRVHELAKELNTTAKELIEKANTKLGIVLKSHSATVSEANIDKIKALYNKKDEKKAKPKAFIVKKQKTKAEDEPQKQEEKVKNKVEITKTSQEPKKVEAAEPKLKSRLEIVRPAPKKAPAPTKIAKPELEKESKKEPVINKVENNEIASIYGLLNKYQLDVLGVIPFDDDLKKNSIPRESKVIQEAIKQFYFRLNLPQIKN